MGQGVRLAHPPDSFLFSNGVSSMSSVSNRPDIETIRKARRYAQKQFVKLRDDYRYCGHSSHAASEAIKQAGSKYSIGYGVEGFCWDCGRDGISYLNMGDTYDQTIMFDSRSDRFWVGCWGDFVERYGDELGIE